MRPVQGPGHGQTELIKLKLCCSVGMICRDFVGWPVIKTVHACQPPPLCSPLFNSFFLNLSPIFFNLLGLRLIPGNSIYIPLS